MLAPRWTAHSFDAPRDWQIGGLGLLIVGSIGTYLAQVFVSRSIPRPLGFCHRLASPLSVLANPERSTNGHLCAQVKKDVDREDAIRFGSVAQDKGFDRPSPRKKPVKETAFEKKRREMRERGM